MYSLILMSSQIIAPAGFTFFELEDLWHQFNKIFEEIILKKNTLKLNSSINSQSESIPIKNPTTDSKLIVVVLLVCSFVPIFF